MSGRRGRGEGSLFFTHDPDTQCRDSRRHARCEGHWTGVASLGRGPDGRRIRRKVSGKSKTEAKEKLDELRATARMAGQVPRGDLTVAHAVRELLDHPPAEWRSEITLANNNRLGERAVRALGTTRVTRLTVGQVEAFLAGMAAEGLATSTIARARSVLRLALRRAQRDHGLGRNVADLATLPRGTRRVSRSMKQDQVDALLALNLDAWWRAFLTVAIMLGLRPGELLALLWEDINLDGGVIRIRHSLKKVDGVLTPADLKTPASKRTLRMPARVIAVLRAHRRQQAAARLALGAAYTDHSLVFCDEAGEPCSRFHVRYMIRKFCKEAGIPQFTTRETRHTFVSVLSDSGTAVERIADAVGHSSSRVTTDVYRHQLADEITTAATAWDELAPGEPDP
jgi:integrase